MQPWDAVLSSAPVADALPARYRELVYVAQHLFSKHIPHHSVS